MRPRHLAPVVLGSLFLCIYVTQTVVVTLNTLLIGCWSVYDHRLVHSIVCLKSLTGPLLCDFNVPIKGLIVNNA